MTSVIQITVTVIMIVMGHARDTDLDTVEQVLSDPIVTLAHGIFQSLMVFDKQHYAKEKFTSGKEQYETKLFQTEKGKVKFKPKIGSVEKSKETVENRKDITSEMMEAIHRYSMDEYDQDIKEYIKDRNSNSSNKNIENLLPYRNKKNNNSFPQKEEYFPNIYKQSSDLFSEAGEIIHQESEQSQVLNTKSSSQDKTKASVDSGPIVIGKSFIRINASVSEDKDPNISQEIVTDSEMKNLNVVDELDMSDKEKNHSYHTNHPTMTKGEYYEAATESKEKNFFTDIEKMMLQKEKNKIEHLRLNTTKKSYNNKGLDSSRHTTKPLTSYEYPIMKDKLKKRNQHQKSKRKFIKSKMKGINYNQRKLKNQKKKLLIQPRSWGEKLLMKKLSLREKTQKKHFPDKRLRKTSRFKSDVKQRKKHAEPISPAFLPASPPMQIHAVPVVMKHYARHHNKEH